MDIKFSGEIFRKNIENIVARNPQKLSVSPTRLAYDSDGYEAGQLLAQNNVSDLFQKYDSGGSSGLDTAACVLLHDVPVEAFESSSDTKLARSAIGGELYADKLIDDDSGSDTDLKARRFTGSDGVEIFIF